MEVNLVGATLVADAMLPLVRPGTSAVFIASIAAHMISPPSPAVIHILDHPLAPSFMTRLQAEIDQPLSSSLAYQLSKHGVIRMCERQCAIWGQRGARIMSVSPGLIASPMGAMEFERQPLKHQLLKTTPLAREGRMREVADAVDFLTSARASFVSGVDLLVDRGLVSALRHT